MSETLRPFEVMRHPECQRLSIKLHQTPHAVVCGPSGSGVSMFVNAHADLFWTRSGTRMCDVLRIVLDDDNTTSTELFQTYPGILENSYKGIIVDLPGTWSRNVLRFFMHKISDRVKVVVVCSQPVKDTPCIFVDTADPNETFQFLRANAHFFPYIPSDPCVVHADLLAARGVLSQVMSRYRFGCSGMDERNPDRYAVKTIDDARKLVNAHFDISQIGDLKWRAAALDLRSFVDVPVVPSLIYSSDQQKEVRETLLASSWFAAIRTFY